MGKYLIRKCTYASLIQNDNVYVIRKNQETKGQ